MNKYSIIFILIAVLLGGVVVWQQQKINSLEEQVTLNLLKGSGNQSPDAQAETNKPTTETPTPPVAETQPTTTEPATPPETTTPPTTFTTPNTIGSTLTVAEAKTKMDATVLGNTEIVGDVVAVDASNANIFYLSAHNTDSEGRATSHIYKYNGDSKKMADWYWERTTSRFWIVGTEGTQVLWIKVPSEPTTDPCWQKWLQPIEALDVKTPTAGTSSFTTPTDILEQATKDQKVCKLVNP